MAKAAPAGQDRTRLIVLLVALSVVAGVALFKNLGNRSTGAERVEETMLTYTPRPMPQLQAELPDEKGRAGEAFERNPFTFGAPPTPTRNLTPPPTRVPPPPRTPRPTPTPRWVDGVDGQRLPPPPPFDRDFIGYLGPSRLTVAVFRKNDKVEVVPAGETIENTIFIVREIGLESVEIGYVGYPEKESTRVPLSQN